MRIKTKYVKVGDTCFTGEKVVSVFQDFKNKKLFVKLMKAGNIRETTWSLNGTVSLRDN